MTVKNQRIKRFIKHLIFKSLIFAIILGIFFLYNIINFPVFTNEMAIEQFENDDYAFAVWDNFIHFRNLFNSYYGLIICIFAGTVI